MAKHRDLKQAKPGLSDFQSKKARLALDPDTTNGQNPSWRISHLEFAGPFGWHNLDQEFLVLVLNKLKAFESMTWNEILIENKKMNHSIPLDRIEKHARDRLIELKLDDVEELVSLRVNGKARIWGIRDQSSLKLLWWDPEHCICPSAKKRT